MQCWSPNSNCLPPPSEKIQRTWCELEMIIFVCWNLPNRGPSFEYYVNTASIEVILKKCFFLLRILAASFHCKIVKNESFYTVTSLHRFVRCILSSKHSGGRLVSSFIWIIWSTFIAFMHSFHILSGICNQLISRRLFNAVSLNRLRVGFTFH